MLKLINIKKSYEDKEVLKSININFNNKGLYVIYGESGSGKSTLLDVICNTQDAQGTILYNGKEILKNDCYYRRNVVSYVNQDNNLFMDLSLKENLLINQVTEYEEYLDILNIRDLLDKKVRLMSAGEKQRSSFLVGITKKSTILVLDEPESNLDTENSERLMKIIKEIAKEKIVILVTHNKEHIEKYADYIFELNQGILNEIKTSNIINPLQVIENKKEKINFKMILKNYCTKIVANSKTYKKFAVLSLLLSFLMSLFSLFSLNNIDRIVYKNYKIHEINECEINVDNIYELKNINEGFSISLNLNYELLCEDKTFSTVVEKIVFSSSIFNLELLEGTYPLNENEIIISSYLRDCFFKNNKIYNENKININGIYLKIVGIYNCDYNKENIAYKKKGLSNIYMTSSQYEYVISNFDTLSASFNYVGENVEYGKFLLDIDNNKILFAEEKSSSKINVFVSLSYISYIFKISLLEVKSNLKKYYDIIKNYSDIIVNGKVFNDINLCGIYECEKQDVFFAGEDCIYLFDLINLELKLDEYYNYINKINEGYQINLDEEFQTKIQLLSIIKNVCGIFLLLFSIILLFLFSIIVYNNNVLIEKDNILLHKNGVNTHNILFLNYIFNVLFIITLALIICVFNISFFYLFGTSTLTFDGFFYLLFVLFLAVINFIFNYGLIRKSIRKR